MRYDAIKVSIIVPIYNVEDYVETCIESIIGQSYKNLEIILVDDGSTDRCPAVCDDYAKRDKRIHVIHKRNGGLVSARKAGIAAATGDYVLNIDGDDWIEKDRIEVLVRDGIMPTHADMIYLSGFIMDFGEEGKESINYNPDIPVKLFNNDEIENTIFPLLSWDIDTEDITIKWALWSWAVRRKLLLKNQALVDDRITLGEDFLCICFCLLEAESVMALQQDGYHYIQRASSIVHQVHTAYDRDPLQMKIWYQLLENQLKQRHASEKVCRICKHIAVFTIIASYRDYDLLLQNFPDCLLPFPNVNNGARIVVYGAGKIGYNLVQSLSKTKHCPIVLWVDQNQNLPTVPGYSIRSRDAIFSVEYDFIVVAIMNPTVAEEVKRSLILDGIPEEKIATMDVSAIS